METANGRKGFAKRTEISRCCRFVVGRQAPFASQESSRTPARHPVGNGPGIHGCVRSYACYDRVLPWLIRQIAANVIIRPPIAWAVSVLAGLALNRLTPLPFVSGRGTGRLGGERWYLPLRWRSSPGQSGSSPGPAQTCPPTRPTMTIVETGPYRFTRNPIYLSMMLGLIGLAIALNSLWLLLTLIPVRSCHPLRCNRPRGSVS